jgi:hypothetical protein
MFYVYQLRIEDDPKPFYVGKGIKRRAWDHLGGKDGNPDSFKNKKIRKAIREGKYILVEFLNMHLSADDAEMWEVFWIAEYGRRDLGFGPLTNGTDGGEGCSNPSAETRKKLSEAATGENNPLFGKSHSEETKKKISDSMSGRKLSEEHKDKIGKSNLNSIRDYSKRNISNIVKAASKLWKIITPDGDEVIVENLTRFCKEQGLNFPRMCDVAKGRANHHKRYKCLLLE